MPNCPNFLLKNVSESKEKSVYSTAYIIGRWKGCAELVEKGLANVLSYMYIQHYDKHDIKAKVGKLLA